MQAALAKIDEDIETNGISDPAVVFLGDYVDRGKRSAEVIEFLVTLSANEPDAVVCLKGNHEQMMLEFIDDPVKHGKRWLRYGGQETLQSFGIVAPEETAGAEALYEAAEELADALPQGALAWMRRLPLQWHSGNLHCVHAAMDPARPAGDQQIDTLLWGHDAFATTQRRDGIWVVHGHTVVDAPTWEFGRVALDTGCWFSGTLTAAAFTSNSCRIL